MKILTYTLKLRKVLLKASVTYLIFMSVIFITSAAKAGINQWTTNGPYGTEIKDIAISPDYANDSTAFASTLRGIYKSVNGGNSWIQLNTVRSNALAISPNYSNDQTIFSVGAALYVYKSIDSGISWLTYSTPIYTEYLATSPNYTNDKIIFAGGSGGVAKSSDGGVSWTLINAGFIRLNVYSLAVSPNFAIDQTVFAGIYNDGIYKSTNGGGSWTKILSIGSDYPEALTLSPNYSIDQTIFVGFWNGSVLKSTNGGTSWTTLSVNKITGFAISSNFSNDKTIFAGSISTGVYKSENGGTTWTAVNNSLPISWVRAIAISPNFAVDQTIFAGLGVNSDGPGIYKSNSGGNLWSEANTGINDGRVIASISFSPDYANDMIVFAGANSDGVYKSTDATSSWLLTGNRGASLAVSPNYVNDQMVFAASWRDYRLYKSIDGGISWMEVSGIPLVGIYDLVFSPHYAIDQTVFAAVAGGVYKSTNGGGSWFAVKTGLTDPGLSGGLVISPNYANDQTLFVGGINYGVFKSTNGGANWTNVYSGPNLERIIISPNYVSDQTLFISVWGKGVFKSTDNGTTWTQVSVDTSYPPTLAISPNYSSDQTIFKAIRSIVYKSNNGGISWSQVNMSGFPSSLSVLKQSLVVSPNYANDNTILVGTNDGVYSFTFPPSCTDVDQDGYAIEGGACGAIDCNDSNSAIYPVAPDIICDGIDNNCNGIADDGYVPSSTVCGYGVCVVTGQMNCVNGQTLDTCTPEQPAGVDDNCNGIDEDCTGVVDDGYMPTVTSCGVGVCSAAGQLVCVGGQIQNNCTVGQPTGADDNCNGVDEDCSGVSDDDYLPTVTSCGEGVCSSTGQLICVSGKEQNTCTAGLPTGTDDNCNGLDEDCNGINDDGYVSPVTYCGFGVCGASGELVCVNGQTRDTCIARQPTGVDDNCNGVDENCSGVADDGYVSIATSCGVGVCGSTGQLVCVAGQIQNSCTAGQPQTEGPVGDPSCNDTLDNDCDENADLADSDCINTPSGQDVTAEPVDDTTGTTPVNVNFSDVTTDGITALTTSGVGAPPPLGFRLGTPPTYYEISTTAGYSGQIEVCIDYTGISYANESTLKLFHHKDNIWEDITSSLDTVNNIICGVTTSLSPFAIFEFYNKPPVAEAGADLSLACLEMTCPVILDGSGSTDPNSTPGTQDDIVSYEWYKNYGAEGEVLLAAGRTISYDLPLGEHKITLVVTDRVGVRGEDEILVRVNPAQLSLLEITKAEVEWEKAGEKPNRVKIHGKVAMPAGKDYYQVNPAGNVTIGISSAANALNQNMAFQVKGDYGSKWEYKSDPTGMGISKYEIDWQGAKFDYNREIRLKSNHLGYDTTTLEIDRKDVTEAIAIIINDITIHIDSTGAVSAVPDSIKVDIDDDGEIEVELPFALAMNTAFSVTHGTASYTVKVGDYYSAAVGKFELMGRFDPNGLNGATRPAILDLGITFGDQGFPGIFHILDGDWALLKNVEWKYKK